jgi:hypothetical protein
MAATSTSMRPAPTTARRLADAQPGLVVGLIALFLSVSARRSPAGRRRCEAEEYR